MQTNKSSGPFHSQTKFQYSETIVETFQAIYYKRSPEAQLHHYVKN